MASPTGPDSTTPDGDGPAPRLTRDLIVAAALDFIDKNGASALSMRNLAQTLQVEAMSLYYYVHGREDLLEAIVATLLNEVVDNLDDRLGSHWQGFLLTVAHEVRQIALAHPNAFPLVATRHPSAPWLRPPLRSLDLVDTFLTTLTGHGLSDEQAVDVYRSFSSFLLGQLLLESAVRGADTSPVEEPLDEGDATVPNRDQDTPVRSTLKRLRPLLSQDRSLEEFEVSLENLLDRIDRDISQ